MKRPLAILAVLVASALGASACSGGASGYAFVFDGETTTQSTVDRELAALKDNESCSSRRCNRAAPRSR